MTWLVAALDARYETHPPRWLSVMLPTRAVSEARSERPGGRRPSARSFWSEWRREVVLGRSGRKCLKVRRCPIVLTCGEEGEGGGGLHQAPLYCEDRCRKGGRMRKAPGGRDQPGTNAAHLRRSPS